MCPHGNKAHWRHLANTIEPPVCGGDAVLCQHTLTTCLLLLYRTVFRRLLTSSVSWSRMSVWRCLSLRGKQYWPVFTNHRIINIDKDYTVFVTNRGNVRNFCLAWGSKNSGSGWPRDLPQHPDKNCSLYLHDHHKCSRSTLGGGSGPRKPPARRRTSLRNKNLGCREKNVRCSIFILPKVQNSVKTRPCRTPFVLSGCALYPSFLHQMAYSLTMCRLEKRILFFEYNERSAAV